MTQTKPLRGAWREVLHEHIRPFQQAMQYRAGLPVLEIEREALLRPVAPYEMRTQATHAFVVGAREVARAGTLDLDHPGAEIGELARAERRRNGVLERHDPHTVQRPHGVRSPSEVAADHAPRLHD